MPDSQAQKFANVMYEVLSEQEEYTRESLSLAHVVGDECKSLISQQLDILADIREAVYQYEQTGDAKYCDSIQVLQAKHNEIQNRANKLIQTAAKNRNIGSIDK